MGSLNQVLANAQVEHFIPSTWTANHRILEYGILEHGNFRPLKKILEYAILESEILEYAILECNT